MQALAESVAMAGDEDLSTEVLESLSNMTLTEDEEKKLRAFKGDRRQLGIAERFLAAILDIPSSFQRINTMLFRATFKDDLLQLEEAITVLEVNTFHVISSNFNHTNFSAQKQSSVDDGFCRSLQSIKLKFSVL